MAGGLGSAFVQVYPVMKGFRKSISSEMGAAGAEGGAKLEGTLASVGSKAGKNLGSGLKAATNSAVAGMGEGALKSFESRVGQAEVALTKAKNKQADADGKVRVAKEQLEAVKKREGATTVELTQAEERLEAAKRKAAEADAVVKTKTEAVKKAKDDLKQATEAAASSADSSGSRWSRLGDTFSSVGSKAGSLAKGALVGLGKAAVAGAAAGGAAMVAIGKQAVESYAEFEQLSGGVTKLFGDEMGNATAASAEVMKNASAAYKTAGLSANEYMETVTGFSASLISSLGGDTEKAAKIADVAVRDMADNANTFGTDIGSLQNAYQGFAKGQFNMLDNLKLGFGGSREEMLRLLSEAEKLSGVHYDIDSFSDITEAIHVIQESMNIAGTTAKEAAGTIEGSMNSMKGAWANLLTSFGTGEGIDESIDALIESAINVLKNIVPRAVEVAGSMMKGIGNAIKKRVPALAPSINVISKAFTDVRDKLAAFDWASVMNKLSAAFVSVQPALNAVISIFKNVIAIAAQVVKALWPVVQFVASNLVSAFTLAARTISGIVSVIRTVVNAFVSLGSAVASAINSVVAVVASLPSRIRGALAGAASWLVGIGSQIIGGLKSGISSAIGTVSSLFSGLGGRVKSAMSGAGSWLRGIGKSIVDGLIAGIGNVGSRIYNKLKSGIDSGLAKVKSVLEINSPSKLIAREVGAPIAEGVAFGVEKEAPAMVSAIGQSLNGITDLRYNVPVAYGSYGGFPYGGGVSAGSAGAGGKVVNQTINVQAVDPASVAAVIAERQRVALGVS